VAACVAVLVLLWRRHKPLTFWYLWGFIWLAAYFNIGSLGNYLMAEKGLYLASAGFCVVVASLILCSRFAPFLLAAIVSVHFNVTLARSTYWRDPVTFFEAALDYSPEFTALRYSLAIAHAEAGNFGASAGEFERVLSQNPGHSAATNNLGNSYFALGDHVRAASMWERALALDPGNANPAYNLGMMAEDAGDLAAALDYYRRYLAAAREVPPAVMARIQRLERFMTSKHGD
jgi:tetratricopeptide (TPR) repeat protein